MCVETDYDLSLYVATCVSTLQPVRFLPGGKNILL